MPELPEVETIVRHLRPRVTGKRIVDLWTNTPRIFRRNFTIAGLKKTILGKTIQRLDRLGKNIVFILSGDQNLFVHLMMAGRLLWNPDPSRAAHIRFWIKLDGEDLVALHDTRKFGWIRILRKGGENRLALGPDPLQISLKDFRDRLAEHRGVIKTLLLNQQFLRGIGNIYSDEILWAAGIHPQRQASSLSHTSIRKLYDAMRKVLQLAIQAEGTTSSDYRKPDGSEGGYFDIRKVYRRTGETCSRDGAIIRRLVIGQRSAHFCPSHQK